MSQFKIKPKRTVKERRMSRLRRRVRQQLAEDRKSRPKVEAEVHLDE